MYTAVARYFCLSVATYCFFSTLSPYNPQMPPVPRNVWSSKSQPPSPKGLVMLRRLPSCSGYSMSSK